LKILVVRLGMLGDSMFIVPALRALRAKYPHATITGLFSPKGSIILPAMGLLDGVLDAVKTYDVYHPKVAKWAVGRFLAKQSFDLLVNFDIDPDIYRFLLDKGQFAEIWRMVREPVADGTRQQLQVAVGDCPHIAKQYTQLVTGELPDSVSYLIPEIRQDIQKKSKKFQKDLRGKRDAFLVGIHPGNHSQDTNTLFQKKNFDPRAWTRDATIGYALRIATAFPGTKFVLTGGWYERKLTRPLLKALRQKGLAVVDVSGKTKKITDLMAIMLALDVYVSGDTGPMHIAASLGVPQIGLFFSTNVNDTGPLGDPLKSCAVISPIPCAPCLHTPHEKQCPVDTNCVLELTDKVAFDLSQSFIKHFYEKAKP
jgi:heptosyltransferase I